MTELEVKLIKLDGGTQARAGTDRDTVNEYVEALRESDSTWPFPPVVVYHDGNAYWLADGFHRITAARQHGRFVCEADVRQGTQRDAILHAAGANADHGLRRTAEDKKRAVTRLLEDAEWGKWSDREIARTCKVSHSFVSKVRTLTGHESSDERVFVNRHGTVSTMNTANIGGHSKVEVAEEEIELASKFVGGCIYVLRDGSFYKIGYTTNLLSRYKESHGTNPSVKLIHAFVCADKRYETTLHNLFSSYRKSGEWFELPQEDVDWITGIDYSSQIDFRIKSKETAVAQPTPSPFYVGPMAQGPEVREALERYLEGQINREMIIRRLANVEASGHDQAMKETVAVLGASDSAIYHQAMVLRNQLPGPSWERKEPAVSHPTSDQIEGLVTRAANDVIDDGDLADYAALYHRWLDDGPDDPDWHRLEKRTAGIPHALVADALRSCYQRVATAETAVSPSSDLMTNIMADVDAYEVEAAQLFAAAPAPRRADYIDPRLASLNTALDLVTRLTADTSLTVDIVGPLARALGLMEDAKKALVKRQQYTAWLRDYQDDDGRRWTDLTDTQTWHKNSPCFQAFVKAFPGESLHKTALMDAKTQLEKEAAVMQEVSA